MYVDFRKFKYQLNIYIVAEMPWWVRYFDKVHRYLTSVTGKTYTLLFIPGTRLNCNGSIAVTS
jgi:hypothetical protein